VFAWTSINAPASTIANPSIKNAVVTPLDTSAYILNAAWGTCRRTDTIIVNVLHKPVSHAGNDTAICNISYAILRGSASNLSGTVNYNWTPATNVEFPGQAVTRVYPAGNDTTYVYTLTVTDNYGCKFSVADQVNVHVQPPVPAYAGNDTIAIKGVPHQLFGSGGVSYLWSPPYPLNSATNQNPLATLENDTKFILQVIDVAGCIGYDTVFVQAYFGPNYYIPNAFSPNGDGLNDVFRPIPVGIVSTDYFRVFNRFGQVIFQTSEWLKGWDGTYKGVKQPIGGYIWIIKGKDRNGKTIEMKGTVMLIQ
jgi:gliding motility-associated-like protein